MWDRSAPTMDICDQYVWNMERNESTALSDTLGLGPKYHKGCIERRNGEGLVSLLFRTGLAL
jgi:hypothetical protein